MSKPSKGSGGSNIKETDVLLVSIISGSNLSPVDKSGTHSDPYCVVSSSFNKQRFKTPVIKKSLNPVWDCPPFKFFTTNVNIKSQSITVRCWNRDRWARDDSLGEVRIDLSFLNDSNTIEQSFELTKEPKSKKQPGNGTIKVKIDFPSGTAGAGGQKKVAVDSKQSSAPAPSQKEKKPIKEVYEFGDELGRGGFSIVRKAIRKETGEIFAVKIIEKNQSEEELQLLQREIDIMQKLDHKNIIKLDEVFDEKDTIYLVMEFVQGGELFDQIVSRGTYSEFDAAKIIRQILEAVEYLHSIGIAHRDLKPENLLCSGDENNTIKVTDFGLSKDFGSASLRTSCGTPDYVAPEVLRGQPYDNSVDIWSIGVITYILLCGFPPFYGNTDQQIFEKILKVDYDFPSPDWDAISGEAKDFIKKILVQDPTKRPTALQALEMDWIKNKAPTKPLERLDFFKAGMSKYNLQYQEQRKKTNM
eukprot:TRINITY_DN615_c0_g1_i1.p1 TRINITY_DN615_c0_g1~~TRINITY_DN615_c0_g1_i1.p1  ORF type:complete len:472 (+),score=95.17 TRINITY_DN615_c0_g1_i1:51-1466(+)